MINKKIAITGASGFLGKNLIEKLKEKKCEIILIGRSSKKINGINTFATDYSINSLREIIKGVDGIIHLAAKRGSNGRIDDFHHNEVITQNLYQAAYENGIKNIVFASSISVYSEQNLLPWNEEQMCTPVSMYGISKLSNECIGNYYSKKYGMNIKSLRLAHLYGALEKNNYMINIFMRKAFLGKKLKVNNSNAKREFLYVKDAAYAIINALFVKTYGVFNIGTNDVLTNLEVAQNINSVFKNDNLEVISGENNIESSYMNSNEANKILNYLPKYSFTTAMEEIKEEMEKVNDIQEIY